MSILLFVDICRYQPSCHDGGADVSYYEQEFPPDALDHVDVEDNEFEDGEDNRAGQHLECFADAIGADGMDLSAKIALASSVCDSVKNG